MKSPAKLVVTAVLAGSVGMYAPHADAATGQAYYVAPNGSDSAAGTQAAPWESIARAQSVAQAFLNGANFLGVNLTIANDFDENSTPSGTRPSR
jgi:hypothetical protein